MIFFLEESLKGFLEQALWEYQEQTFEESLKKSLKKRLVQSVKQLLEKFWGNSWNNPNKDYTGRTYGGIIRETPRKISAGILVEIFLRKSLEYFLEESLEEHLTEFLEGLLKVLHLNRSKNPSNDSKFSMEEF